MTTETRSVDVPGGHLYVAIDGTGPPIVLAHAGIADLRAWDPLVPLLVDAGYRAVRYDARGFGRSATDDVEFSNRADLRAVLDALGIERACLVGNSRGAMICLDTVLESPERVVAFAWVGGGVGGFEAPRTAEEGDLLDAAEAAAEAFDADTGVELDLRAWVDGVGQPPTRVDPAIRAAVALMDRPLYERDRIFGRPIPLEPQADGRLGEIAIPVLAVVGALDTSDTRASAERLERGVSGARRVVLPGVAHMVGMEAPEALLALILELVQPLGTWG